MKSLLSAPKVQRPVLCNFILHTAEGYPQSNISSIVDETTREYPCQLFILRKTEEHLYMISADGFSVQTREETHLPLLLFSLLKSDVPTYLFWGYDITTQHFSFIGIDNYLTKVMLDSTVTASFIEFTTHTLRLMNESLYAFADLNWHRIEQWQQIFAHQFNDNEKIRQIARASKITISFHVSSPIQAIYLQAWIALKLQWKYYHAEKRGESWFFFYETVKGRVEVQLLSVVSTLQNDKTIDAIRIESHDQVIVEFEQENRAEQKLVAIKQTSETACQLPKYYFLDDISYGKSFFFETYTHCKERNFYRVLREISLYPQEVLVCL